MVTMGRANTANRNTNKRELENLDGAYGRSGESMWSRQAGSGRKVETVTLVDTSTMSRLELLIHRNVRELLNYQERVNTSSDPAEVARLTKNIRIKQKFLDRLRAEQRRS